VPKDARMTDAIDSRITTLLARFSAFWNTSDMDGLFSLCRDDIHWVNVVGMHWSGKPEALLAHRAFFATMFRDVPLTLRALDHVKDLGGDVFVVVVTWTLGAFKTPGGDVRPENDNRMSLVLVPDGKGDLAISHVANIDVDARAAAFDPVKRAQAGSAKKAS